jgi:hypothetical protein
MAWDRDRPPLESEQQQRSATPFRDIQMQIGQALRLQYELPQDLPDQLLTLLMQLSGSEENN